MKKILSLCLSLLLLTGPAAQAEPLTALLALIVADKMIGKEKAHKATSATNKSWRQSLNTVELGALQQIKQHPAIQACIKQANDNHPAAQYHLRKIAQFSVSIQAEMQTQGHIKDMQYYTFRHPGKGFNWCQRQAGIQVTDTTSIGVIKQGALQLARTNLGNAASIRIAMIASN